MAPLARIFVALLAICTAAGSLADAQSAAAVFSLLDVDTSHAELSLGDIRSGGPPPQGIPALGFAGDARGVTAATPAPAFVTAVEAASWMSPEEPVVMVSLDGASKAYPLQILTWHEIVNDTVGTVPVAVTFCPLCASALAFDRRIPLTDAEARRVLQRRPAASLDPPGPALLSALPLDAGRDRVASTVTVTFGVSGLLANSNLLMFDSLTATLWPQLVGTGAVGTLAGAELVRYPAQIVSFASFRAAHPDGLVLSRKTGFRRDYGRNPYVGYDRADTPPFLYDGKLDARLPPKARVVVLAGDPPFAYPYALLAERHIVNDVWRGNSVAVFWAAGTRSALGAADVADGADVGSVGVYGRELGDRTLSFAWRHGEIRDLQTGSSWNVLGEAVDGPLRGSSLAPILHTDTFWFAYAAFRPNTVIRGREP